jgi:cytochrome b6-f complex iron-sulfur subunit
MASGLSSRTRFFFFQFFLLVFFASASFAGTSDMSDTVSFSSTIITAGFGGLALLALYLLYLTAGFLKKALKESAEAKKETASHAPAGEAKGGSCLVSLVSWASGAFAVLSVGILLLVTFFLMIEKELSATQSFGALIIKIGFAGFALLALYVAFLTLAFLWRAFRGPAEPEAQVPAPAAGLTGEAALASLPLNPEVTRRSFLSLLGWAWVAFTAASLGAVSTVLRFFFPNVTFEPPLKFKVGFPNQFASGVDNRFKDDHRVWIVRNETGFYALSTICTHLGCTPNWLSVEQKFKCPCHGSGFYITGINFEGPAPRPLERFKIALADDGQIEVDEGTKYQYEKGEWNKGAGDFLEYRA